MRREIGQSSKVQLYNKVLGKFKNVVNFAAITGNYVATLDYAKKFQTGPPATIQFPKIDVYDLGTSDFTIEVYFNYLTDIQNGSVVMGSYRTDELNSRSFALATYSEGLRFYTSIDGAAISNARATFDYSAEYGNWVKLEMKKIGTKCVFRVNGNNLYATGSVHADIFNVVGQGISVGSRTGETIRNVVGSLYNPKLIKHKGEIDLFILAGQSNMKGNETNSIELPTSLRATQEAVFSYSLNFSDATSYESEYQPLEPQFYYGPELNFGYLARENKGKEIAILKVADGGTGFGEGQWVKGGVCYNDLINRYNTFISNLTSRGYNVNVKGLVWMQGENDTRSLAWANAYSSNFQQFHSDLTTDLSLPSTLPVIMGRIHDDLPTGGAEGRYDYSTEVRAQQDLLGQLDYITLINTDSLSLNIDSIHFDRNGTVKLGELFYNACDNLNLFTSVPTEEILMDLKFDSGDNVDDVSSYDNDSVSVNTTSFRITTRDLPL